MKNPSLRPLIKDLLIIVILGGFMLLMANSISGGEPTGIDLFLCFAVTGIPFGWRWAKKMFVAVTVKGFFIKVLWAALLGCIAIFVVVIGDLINYLKSLKAPVE